VKKIRNIALSSIVLGCGAIAALSEYQTAESHITATRISTGQEQLVASSSKSEVSANYGRLPIYFEPNVGQSDESVRYLAHGHGYSLALKDTETVIALRRQRSNKGSAGQTAFSMKIDGANVRPKISGMDLTEARSNYLIGNDPAGWHADVPNFAKVRYENVLDGVDAVYYGNGQQLEYDFVVAPGADPAKIKLNFTGIRGAKIEKKTGDLILATPTGSIKQLRPIAYQDDDRGRTDVAVAYNLVKDRETYSVTFDLGEYDRDRTLVIDPILAYGSYLGGSLFDEGRGVAVDAQGNAYVVGTSASRNFPTTPGTIKPTLLPSEGGNQYWYDAFVSKVNPTGTALVYSTYFGGRNGSETGSGVTVDNAGNALISGTTMSNDLPVVNAYQPTFGGTDDAFAAKLNATGSAIIYSTYLGGNNTDLGGRIALNRTTGDAVFAGTTSSPNFPTTPGAFKERLCDGTPGSCNGIFYSGSYLVKLSTNGNIVFSTLFDAAVNDVVLDANDNALFGGSVSGTTFPATPGGFQTTNSGGIEGFLAKMNPAGTAPLVYGTYLGGGLQSDRVTGVAIDGEGNMYATGRTENTGFPTTAGVLDRTFNGVEDGFVTKLNPAGSALVYSTFFGGPGKDQPFAIDLAPNGDAFIAGETLSGANFPLRNSINGTNGSIFVSRLSADASSIVFSSLLGVGGAYDLVTDAAGNAYATGQTTSFQVTNEAFQIMKGDPSAASSVKDAFIVKLAPTDENAPMFTISGTVTDPTQFGNYQPITVTLTGAVNRSIVLPYGNGSGVIPYAFGSLPAGGNYTVTARKIGFVTTPESVEFTNLQANQFADFTIQANQQPEGVITSPAHGATYNAPATITIQATASDPDGDPITKVDFYAYSSSRGNLHIGTDMAAPYEITWENVPVDTWSLSAIPTDSHGLAGYSTPVVHVFVVDASPLNVSITSPTEGQTFTEGGYVPIAVTVSPSVDHHVEVRTQTGELIAWLTHAPWQTTWRVMNTGDYTLIATAFSTQGQQVDSAPVHISVHPLNHRLSGRIYNSVSNVGIAGVTVDLVCPSSPSVHVTTTTDSTGNYLFTDLGLTPNDSVTITPSIAGYTLEPADRSIGFLGYIDWTNLNFAATQVTGISVSMTSPVDGQTYVAPATVHFEAEASTTNGSIARVNFYKRDGVNTVLLGSDTSAPYAFDWTGVGAGIYFVFVEAVDNTNNVARSGEARITVNAQPTLIRLQGEITNPQGGWMQGITVRLTGTVNGQEVNQTSVSNSFGAYGFFNLTPGGDYTITPQGAGGMTFTPPSVTILNATTDRYDVNFVSSASNQPPSVTINSPTEGSVYVVGDAIPVNVAATDGDGQVVHLRVTAQNDHQSFLVGEANTGTFSAPWAPTQPGEYIMWATARDNGGLQTSVSLHFTVNPPGPVSISGRVVDRGSNGIEGVTMELRDYPQEQNVVATALTGADGRYTLPNIPTFASYILRAAKEDFAFAPQQRIYINLNTTQNAADFTGTLQIPMADFDGDGMTDISIWRPSTGYWWVNRSNGSGYMAAQFGGGQFGDIVAPGNYDGDRRVDYAVFRSGTWYVRNSSNGSLTALQFGLPDDTPVPADFDGDGRTDIAVFRSSTGIWYVHRSSDGAFDAKAFGTNGDVPVAADYDGDGMADAAVWRPQNGTFYVLQSTNLQLAAAQFGTSGDKPVVGDFDGDKKADFAVFRPSAGNWYVLASTTGIATAMHWGQQGDMPVAGDYDHDGKTDLAVYRESEHAWYVRRSSNGTHIAVNFGLTGDVPIPAAFIDR
jgi:hypothetical protein